MAVEEAEEVKAEESPPKKAKSKLLLILVIGVLLVALLGVGGFIVYKQVMGGGNDADKKAETAAAAKKEASKLGVVTGLDPFIVNLAGEAGKRYIKVTMQLELSSKEGIEEVQQRMPQIKDSVITVLSSKTTEDLLTVDGKFQLKEQILTRVNILLQTGVVKNVYFVEFVIQ